jgi:hypothetical protein
VIFDTIWGYFKGPGGGAEQAFCAEEFVTRKDGEKWVCEIVILSFQGMFFGRVLVT